MNSNFKMVVTAVILAGLLAGPAQGNFGLSDNQQLTVDTYHYFGWLYQNSPVDVVSGGIVESLMAYESSSVNISGG